ncbi:MAG: ABC-type transport auxiliary lipoprotein family protein [Novosphingobium sp.]|nr:ABC-type transport auxiliary lipoprotein family protein [Novosphingobium sp.]
MTAKDRARRNGIFGAAALALLLALPGCVSLGGKVPDQLMTLTPDASAGAGTSASGTLADAIAVLDPGTPRELDVQRVPVQVNDTEIAYLKDATWVEKPARLFRNLLSETIQAGGTRLVLGGADERYAAATKLTGQLLTMGYDARTQSVVVRYDAVLASPGGKIATRRFESVVANVRPKAKYVGPALNEAANGVAAQVAQWVK